MKSVEEYYVPWLPGQKMYVSPHIELAWREPKLARLMSNENQNPPSQKVIDTICKYGKIANLYPDQGLVLRSKIAEINGLDGPENVMIGNGSSEIYDMIFRSFVLPGDEVIQHTPCFGIYKLRCLALGGKLVSVPMDYDLEKKALLFNVDSVLSAITPKTKIVVIAHPGNPTGNFMDDKDLVKIAETGVPFLVDEAYIEFSGLQKSQVALTKKYRNVFVTRTLSKAYALAGLRFGYALGNKDVIMQMAAMLCPWNVGLIPMWAALAAFEDTEGLKERVDHNNSELAYIENALKDVPGLTIFHSAGNYILFDCTDTGKKGEDVVAYAQTKGIILRKQDVMYGRSGFFRITIGLKEQNRAAVKAIKEFLTS